MREKIRRIIPFSPPDITEAEIMEVAKTLESGWITTGPRTKLLERRLAAFIASGRTDIDCNLSENVEKYSNRVVRKPMRLVARKVGGKGIGHAVEKEYSEKKQLSNLLKDVKKDYDYILIDCIYDSEHIEIKFKFDDLIEQMVAKKGIHDEYWR